MTKWSSNRSKKEWKEVTHTDSEDRKIATLALIHTGTRKKNLIKIQTRLNFNKWLITMIYLHVMTTRMKEEKEDKIAAKM